MIRVFIADDQLLVREGLRALLDVEPEIAIAGEASDGAETIEKLRATDVDVLLLDVRMPRKSGLDVLKELGTPPPTLVLTTFDDADVALEAIRAIAAGGTLFQPALTSRLAQRTKRVTKLVEQLTPREIEVVRLMAGGYSNSEIAHALGAADGTVKNHVSNILSKLGARDRTRAVLKALEAGVL